MNKQILEPHDLMARLTAQGVGLVGFADISPLDAALRWNLPRAIAIGIPLNPAIVAGITAGPTEEYCREYERLNALLNQVAESTVRLLQAGGWSAHACKASGDWDKTTFRAPFQHKTAATLAGLGWIGRCNLLITPEFGSALRWNTVLTDAPFPTGTPVTASRCGECHVCVQICPGQACSGKLWKSGMTREDLWDPSACMRGMSQASAGRAVNLGICGRCIANCPWTQNYLKRSRQSRSQQ